MQKAMSSVPTKKYKKIGGGGGGGVAKANYLVAQYIFLFFRLKSQNENLKWNIIMGISTMPIYPHRAGA